MTATRVLLVWGDRELARAAAAALIAAGYDTRWEVDSLAGLSAVEDWQPALIVLDWDLPFVSGSVFLHAVNTGLDQPPPVVALGERLSEAEATALGAATSLRSPVQCEQLVNLVTAILSDATRVHESHG